MKIVHIITGLNTGGAEMMLFKLLSTTDREEFESEVISLTDIGPLGKKIASMGIRVQALNMRKSPATPFLMLKLIAWLRRIKPDIVQTWMYHADLIGGLSAKMAGGIPLAWGIRQSNLDSGSSKRTTIWTAKLCARLSQWLPEKIVCCSKASQQVHGILGYAEGKMVMIPNGFDLETFVPDTGARVAVREELGLRHDTPLVGLVGRFDPQKDHHNFTLAATRLQTTNPDTHYLLCGDGIHPQNAELAGWIENAGLSKNFHLLGRRVDIPRLVAALDIAASSSSFGEGFPNVVGEAMACGIPCVVTNIGDSALIVGDTGLVVPPRNPAAFADALNKLLRLSPQACRDLGQKARQRIEENYSLSSIAKQYEALYRNIAEK